MDRKNILRKLAYLIFSIFALNFLAGKFYLYTSIWFFDMPMHFLGGFWLGLSFIYLFWSKTVSVKLFIEIILGVLLLGVLWELFEVIFTNYIGQTPFNTLDTISDLCFDLAGGLSAILYIFRYERIMSSSDNRV
jgi:TRAP-type C4-dicarboxylate transport system permease small subunit